MQIIQEGGGGKNNFKKICVPDVLGSGTVCSQAKTLILIRKQ